MTVVEKIAALREMMQRNQLAAYIVPGTDPHASEYMASHWCEMQWLSGFQGESGTVVVTTDRAFLWTDSRYYLQAGVELEGSTIELMRESDIDCPSVIDWLCANIQGTVGMNPKMYSANTFAAWQAQFAEAGIGVQSIDLIAPLWTEGRPAIPQDVLYPYSADFAGETVESKLARVREVLNAKCKNGEWALISSALDEIAWLLNIRGNDVEYNPVVISFVVLEPNKCTLFVDANKVDSPAQNYLDFNNIDVLPYEAVYDYIGGLKATIFYDG
ncbi:MAG: aminopeptidase P family N-terminal domain-containing protein, partial [Paludibacteraceae bacterium]|nr:aminopeptidase P family N-terminal domain-containing protein [Paludibacteraceae bacterium]